MIFVLINKIKTVAVWREKNQSFIQKDVSRLFIEKKFDLTSRVLPCTCMTCARKKSAFWPNFNSSEPDFLKRYPQVNSAFDKHKKIWMNLLKMKKIALKEPRYPSCVSFVAEYSYFSSCHSNLKLSPTATTLIFSVNPRKGVPL